MRKPTTKIPVYDVRLVRARKPLRLAESIVPDQHAAVSALYSLIGLTDREHLAVLFLDGRYGITGAHVAAMGGQHGMNVDARPILRAALLACASAMVIGHNHPSGDPSPSADDLAFTAALMRSAKVVGVALVDHVIVTRIEGRHHSMLDRGTLPTV